jgi:transcriptional regulator with XRE-family HTH domain
MLCEKTAMTIQTPIPTAIPAVREHFAKRLKELRIPRGFPTARSLSRALGIDENRYTRYERAEVEPDLSLLLKICSLLRASPNDLLVPSGFDDPHRPYIAEPPSESAHAKSHGAAAHSNGGPSDPLRRRAVAWQLASELVTSGAVTVPGDSTSAAAPLARMQRIKSLFSEIEADAFGMIGRVLDDARMQTVAREDAEKIASLVAELMASIATDGARP